MQFDNRRLSMANKCINAQQIRPEAEVELQPEYLRRIPAPCTFTAVTTFLIWFLHDCVKESEIINDTLKAVQGLAVFIRSSPTRIAHYQHIAKEINDNSTQVENPNLMCPMQGTVRTKAISAVLQNYKALHYTLLSIAKESSMSTLRDTASGMASQFKNSSTYPGLRFAQNIFSECKQVASTIQKPSITVQTTVTCVNSSRTNLQRQRDDCLLFYD